MVKKLTIYFLCSLKNTTFDPKVRCYEEKNRLV